MPTFEMDLSNETDLSGTSGQLGILMSSTLMVI